MADKQQLAVVDVAQVSPTAGEDLIDAGYRVFVFGNNKGTVTAVAIPNEGKNAPDKLAPPSPGSKDPESIGKGSQDAVNPDPGSTMAAGTDGGISPEESGRHTREQFEAEQTESAQRTVDDRKMMDDDRNDDIFELPQDDDLTAEDVSFGKAVQRLALKVCERKTVRWTGEADRQGHGPKHPRA